MGVSGTFSRLQVQNLLSTFSDFIFFRKKRNMSSSHYYFKYYSWDTWAPKVLMGCRWLWFFKCFVFWWSIIINHHACHHCNYTLIFKFLNYGRTYCHMNVILLIKPIICRGRCYQWPDSHIFFNVLGNYHKFKPNFNYLQKTHHNFIGLKK